MGPANFFSCIVTRMNRSPSKNERIQSFPTPVCFIKLAFEPPFHLPFSYLYERGIVDFLSSHDYLLVIITCLYDICCPCNLTCSLIPAASHPYPDTLSWHLMLFLRSCLLTLSELVLYATLVPLYQCIILA